MGSLLSCIIFIVDTAFVVLFCVFQLLVQQHFDSIPNLQ
jgi:hypothetical protein